MLICPRSDVDKTVASISARRSPHQRSTPRSLAHGRRPCCAVASRHGRCCATRPPLTSLEGDLERRRVDRRRADVRSRRPSGSAGESAPNAGRVTCTRTCRDDLGASTGNHLQQPRGWVSRWWRKLGESSNEPGLIKTVPGVVYTIRSLDEPTPPINPPGAGPGEPRRCHHHGQTIRVGHPGVADRYVVGSPDPCR